MHFEFKKMLIMIFNILGQNSEHPLPLKICYLQIIQTTVLLQSAGRPRVR